MMELTKNVTMYRCVSERGLHMGGKGREADHEHRFVLPPPGGEQTTGQCSCGMKREFSNVTETSWALRPSATSSSKK